MMRKRLLVGAVLAVAVVVASTSVAWSKPVLPDGTSYSPDPASTTGITGPAGPQQISPVAAYFKRVTYTVDELGQYQETGLKLPAGRYLVEVTTPHAASPPDCLGVSFPLVPPHGTETAFTGYVTVAKSGDEVTISCYEQATGADSTASYELMFIPARR
ncbi:MAG TPA: hypothetical protein VHX15_10310 [Frankiaceae bacterium]|jgi:hypothetical protein|nr:hypothetical protein [Frankiaceae bacterium]